MASLTNHDAYFLLRVQHTAVTVHVQIRGGRKDLAAAPDGGGRTRAPSNPDLTLTLAAAPH